MTASPLSVPVGWLSWLVWPSLPRVVSVKRLIPSRCGSIVSWPPVRNSITESWSTLRVELSNTGSRGLLARVVVFYPEKPDVQFVRDLFVPARSSRASWITVSPASEQNHRLHRDMNILLYDRTDGQDRLVTTTTGERMRNRGIFYRVREPTTAILVDESEMPEGFDKTEAPTAEVITLARCAGSGWSFRERERHYRALPPGRARSIRWN